MARRKNTKRIDPRYFLNETTHRDEIEEGKLNSEWSDFHREIPPKELVARIRQDKGEDWYRGFAAGGRMVDLINSLGPQQMGTKSYDPNDLEKYGLADHPLTAAHMDDWGPDGSRWKKPAPIAPKQPWMKQ